MQHQAKIKIGTQMDPKLYQRLKIAAARSRHSIAEVIETAVREFLHGEKTRQKTFGLKEFLTSDPLKLTRQEFRQSMEADFYDQ